MTLAKDFVIFRAGKYPQGTYTVKDLDEMVETFNEDEPPHIIIGHSSDYKGQTRIPSFGQLVGGIKRVGEDLVAIGAEFHDKLAEFIKEGFYNQRSVEIIKVGGKKKIFALGMLGATPPAVKGLPAMDETLDEIAMQFSEQVAVEFSEKPLEFDAIEDAEALAKDDTKKSVAEICARLSESVSTMIDGDEADEKISQEIYGHFDSLFAILRVHNGFMEKVEAMEENNEAEMSEKFSLVKMFKQIFSAKPKEVDVTPEQENALKAQIADLTGRLQIATGKITEFSEAQRIAEEQKLVAIETAKDETLRAEIKNFLDQNGKNLMIVDELNLPELMFAVAKANATVVVGTEQKPMLVVFQDLISKLPTAPLGESKLMDLDGKKKDERPKVFQDAEAYVNTHASEFADLKLADDKISRALFLRSMNKIQF